VTFGHGRHGRPPGCQVDEQRTGGMIRAADLRPTYRPGGVYTQLAYPDWTTRRGPEGLINLSRSPDCGLNGGQADVGEGIATDSAGHRRS
jgi:hypothetical protein